MFQRSESKPKIFEKDKSSRFKVKLTKSQAASKREAKKRKSQQQAQKEQRRLAIEASPLIEPEEGSILLRASKILNEAFDTLFNFLQK